MDVVRANALEFEFPGDKVLISREGDRLIIEPVRKPGLTALLAQWAKEPPLGPEDDFPEINDAPIEPEEIFWCGSCWTPTLSAT